MTSKGDLLSRARNAIPSIQCECGLDARRQPNGEYHCACGDRYAIDEVTDMETGQQWTEDDRS